MKNIQSSSISLLKSVYLIQTKILTTAILIFFQCGIIGQPLSVIDIFDGSKVTGNKHFYFISPIAPDPPQTISFNNSFEPRIKIYELENGIPLGQPIGEFNFGDKDGVKLVNELGKEFYQLNWKLKNYSLNPNNNYQVRVFVDNLMMGFVTISGNLKNRTIPIKFLLEDGCNDWAVIGPDGGIIQFLNGIEFDIPVGAVDVFRTIGTFPLPTTLLQGLLNERSFRSSAKNVLGGFIGEPDGLTFTQKITVKMPIRHTNKLPIQVKMSLDPNEYWITPTELIYNPETDIVEYTMVDFSGHSTVEVVGAEVELPNNCSSGRIRVVVNSSDFQGGQGCQIIGESVKVTFLDCPNTPTQSVNITETTPECDELGLKVEVLTKNVRVCRSKPLQASVKDKDGVEWQIPLTWSIQSSPNAKLSSGNAITGLSVGSVLVKAKTADPRIWGTGTIEVLQPPPIIVSPSTVSIEVNEEETFTALDENGNPYKCDGNEETQVSWMSLDINIATINSWTGTVKGVEAGDTQVKATLGSAIGYGQVYVEGVCDADNDGKIDENMLQGWRVCCCGASGGFGGWPPCPAPDGYIYWGQKCKTGEIRGVILPKGTLNGWDYIDWSDNGITNNITSLHKGGIDASVSINPFNLVGEGLQPRSTINKELIKSGLEQIIIYPNPACNIVSVESPIQRITKIEIYSFLGQKLKEIDSNFNTISIEELSKGVYITKISFNNTSVFKRFVKE